MVGYLFSGQGSQYIGMGKGLYESFPEARAVFDKADQVLGFSLSKLCFEGPQEELTKTNNCQPAIVTTTIAAWQAFKSVNRVEADAYAAGLSLGEYSALVASGAIKFEDAVYLVRRRGEFMEEEARLKPGKMLSIIGLEYTQVKQVCDETVVEIANLNCPGQIVVSGGVDNILKAQSLAKAKGAKLALILDVSGAFHSSFMKGASLKLAVELEKIKIKIPSFPLISNVSAKPALSVEEIKNNLIKQVASSVLWEDSIKFMLSKRVKNFIEFGPGKVLKGLMRRISPESPVLTVEKTEDIVHKEY
ncbi:MAG: ACP S-malonyltransferase [Candidatus Omnitrophota bacterium]|jgi:[acyl-carrier-protein] S-malonyltransferase